MSGGTSFLLIFLVSLFPPQLVNLRIFIRIVAKTEGKKFENKILIRIFQFQGAKYSREYSKVTTT